MAGGKLFCLRAIGIRAIWFQEGDGILAEDC